MTFKSPYGINTIINFSNESLSDEIQKIDDEDNNARVTSVEIGSIDQTDAPSSQSCDTNMSQNLDED